MDADNLKAGDDHYQAYVGPPRQYDFMGASQFRLLCALGLRAHHTLLDFGCGSLRGGRLFLTYLDPGHYFGIEPNRWLIDDAIEHQIGADLVGIKQPRFAFNSDFDTAVFGRRFDFIVAQSIFSHTGPDLTLRALRSFRDSLEPAGLIAATFREGESDFPENGWVYVGNPDYNFHPSPVQGPVTYRPETIREFAAAANLAATRLPWYHPRQAWYVLATDPGRLPTGAMMRHLSGAVLFDPQFSESW